MATTNPPYEKLAMIWDQMGQDRHSINMIPYCEKIFRRFGIAPSDGLDLCCGTGTAIGLLQELGISMSGLDGSRAMLAMAARKLKGRKVRLYHKQLPTFRLLDEHNSRLTRRFDLITSFYDSLNYLTKPRQLQAAMRTVFRHLRPGGWFVFDVNTSEALRTIWNEQVYADCRDDLAWVWKNEFKEAEKLAACYATCFYLKGKHWQRFDEVHWERGFEKDELKAMLLKAGFLVKGIYRCGTFRRPAKGTFRLALVAHKPVAG